MGVPAFFRWLSEKYPKALTPVHDVTLQQQETGAECDHLYVDMNGVIHPCAHPEDRSAPESEEAVFIDLLAYLDRLVGVTRPTTLIYLAIDGVAPRAKMNQQRARRWKAAKEAAEKREMEMSVRAELTGAARGPEPKEEWDSNVITPGTPFMQRLSTYIRHGVAQRQQGDCEECAPEAVEHWKRCAVVFSDATVPGEGEHKIMGFVRDLRHVESYDPTTRHVLHGLDADLIMLALATHESSFSILREEVLFGRQAKQQQEDHKRQRDAHDALGGNAPPKKSWVYNKRLQILSVATLREYLEVEFASIDGALKARNAVLAKSPADEVKMFDFDFERVVDDFVFLCFFVGNDFLPHLPSLDIREGALDMLLNVYKAALPRLGGYLTSDGGFIDMSRLGKLLCDVGRVEDEIFQRRRRHEEDDKQQKQRQRQQKQRHAAAIAANAVNAEPLVKKPRNANASAAEKLKYQLMGKEPPVEEEETPPMKDATAEEIKAAVDKRLAEKQSELLDKCSEDLVDDVCLGVSGWKDRYYSSQFKKQDIELNGGKNKLLEQYVLGLEWVLRYYYEGCVSWSWFFPFHYAPFASDLAELVCERDEQGKFDNKQDSFATDDSIPFSPLQQLMAVLPAASAHAMPPKCRHLMCSEESELKEFYTDEVEIDPNGKAMPWLHVVLLPFVDVAKLVETMSNHEPLFEPDDELQVEANTRTEALLFVRCDHELASLVASPEIASEENKPRIIAGDIAATALGGVGGNRRVGVGSRIAAPPETRLSDIEKSSVASCFLKDPSPKAKHVSKLLPGVVMARGVLDSRERQQPRPPPRLGRRGTPQVAELGLEAHNDDVRLAAAQGAASPAMAALLQPKRSWAQMAKQRDDAERSTQLQRQRQWGSAEPQHNKRRNTHIHFDNQNHQPLHHNPLVMRGQPPFPGHNNGNAMLMQQQQQQQQQQQMANGRHAFNHPGQQPPPRPSFHTPQHNRAPPQQGWNNNRPNPNYGAPNPNYGYHHQPPPQQQQYSQQQQQQYSHQAPPRPPPSSDFLQAQLAKALQQRRQQPPGQQQPYPSQRRG